jgi:hypothetical protein
MIRDQKGFVITGLLFLIPFLLLLFISIQLFTGFLTFDQSLKKICREELWKLQDRDQKKIQRILSLNPLSQVLKSEYNLLLIKLAQATALGRAELVAYYSSQILKVQSHRSHLDKAQKVIMESSRFQRNVDLLRLRTQLIKAAKPFEQSDFFKTNLRMDYKYLSPMAVRPTSQDLAPSYELETSFEEKQAVYANWKITFQNGPGIAKRLPFFWTWKRECVVTLEKTGQADSWKKIIRADKFFWR